VSANLESDVWMALHHPDGTKKSGIDRDAVTKAVKDKVQREAQALDDKIQALRQTILARPLPPPPAPPRARPYVAEPGVDNKYLPNPPGTDKVRAVLNELKPVPRARLDYFKSLDQEPLIQDGTIDRTGWWIYVERVELRPDGWIADLRVLAKIDASRAANHRLYVSAAPRERYQYQNGAIQFLGLEPDPNVTGPPRINGLAPGQ
jgi:hypothetical protein